MSWCDHWLADEAWPPRPSCVDACASLAVQVKAYAKCTNEQGLAVVWACRPALRQMNECLKQFTTEEALAEEKAAYKASAGARQEGS